MLRFAPLVGDGSLLATALATTQATSATQHFPAFCAMENIKQYQQNSQLILYIGWSLDVLTDSYSCPAEGFSLFALWAEKVFFHAFWPILGPF